MRGKKKPGGPGLSASVAPWVSFLQEFTAAVLNDVCSSAAVSSSKLVSSRSSPPMSLDVSFSLRPSALEEVIHAMTATHPTDPLEGFQSIWHGVRQALEDASIHAMPSDRRLLSRLSALLLYGEWHATPLDLPAHPKLAGYCLVPAQLIRQPSADQWTYIMRWDCFGSRYVLSRKVLCILAWHLSTRENRDREFRWCRRAAWLLRKLLQRWRQDRTAVSYI